jgi:hypothetical protein
LVPGSSAITGEKGWLSRYWVTDLGVCLVYLAAILANLFLSKLPHFLSQAGLPYDEPRKTGG